jgi:hypothetical protein
LLTFIIEISFALYVFFKYKATTFTRLCVITLGALGVFQLSEFLICTTPFVDEFMKVGYVCITLLPTLGLHIAYTITKKGKTITILSYVACALLLFCLLIFPKVAYLTTCNPNYVSFKTNSVYGFFHYLYYGVFMLAGILVLLYSIFKTKGHHKAEWWMIISYLVFTIPATALLYLKVIEDISLPSVMCGFAILTALIFVLKIIPINAKKKKK